jgi:hypothetical protein
MGHLKELRNVGVIFRHHSNITEKLGCFFPKALLSLNKKCRVIKHSSVDTRAAAQAKR